MKQSRLVCACLALMTGWISPGQSADAPETKPSPRPESTTVTVVQPNDVPAPRLLAPCASGKSRQYVSWIMPP